MTVYHIPPGLYCVPSALCALTGADAASVIVPAINRHSRERDLLEAPAGVRVAVARAVLEELGYVVRPFRFDAPCGPLNARVATWARRTARWPGRAVFVTTRGGKKNPGHALVIADERVYDNHVAVGAGPDEHPFSRDVVSFAALVEKRA